uniref:Uncharacterized protein n=1 Tax=Oryza rufipogon TaxID=4529 RepID=A0A0E0PQG1_ORYRU
MVAHGERAGGVVEYRVKEKEISRCLLRSLRRRQDESRLNRGGPGGDLHRSGGEGRGSWRSLVVVAVR